MGSMSINDLSSGTDQSVYYDPDFRNVLEDHITYLKLVQTTTTREIPPGYAARYRGNFYMFLQSQGIQQYMHWVIMRMNDMTSPTQFDESMTTYLIPDVTTLSQIRSYDQTSRQLNI